MTDATFRATPEEVYVLPAGEEWLLVSPRTLTSATVNGAAVDAVAAWAAGDTAGVPGQVGKLWEQLSKVPADARPASPGPEKLVVIPTRSCNMRCVYCDFGAASVRPTTLDPRLACRLIDDAVAKLLTASQAVLRVHFFGGEPLVARSCVEAVIHYARMVCARTGLTPWFEITSNGLFDASCVPLLGDYMDSAVISLDGAELAHDFNRRRADGEGTYAAIAANVRQLGRFPVELSLRTCVTSRSVDDMTATASHFCSEFEFDVMGFEMMTPNLLAMDAGLGPPDPYRFASGVLKAEATAATHGVRVIHAASELVGPRTSSCPVGRGTLMLNPDGTLTACYLAAERWTRYGIDPVLGWVDPVLGPMVDDGKIDAIVGLLQRKPRCARCFCRHTCAGGCHVEQTPPGCSLEYDDRCRATRLITAGRLLRNLAGTAAAESLLERRQALQAVAENPDDRLAAWNRGGAQ